MNASINMANLTPDDLENDDEMKAKLEQTLMNAHPEEDPKFDLFATDALGNPPADDIRGGEDQSNPDGGSDDDVD